ncbi:hypothetical protein CFP56_031196 [Quercus suber]|uniref:Uncharacterized protein n=1 Tax=Quercus suber TaxID=58331 RepID=A0AAW0JK35_QUESU
MAVISLPLILAISVFVFIVFFPKAGIIAGMAKLQLFFQSLFVILAALFYLSHADVGTAAQYKTPYLRMNWDQRSEFERNEIITYEEVSLIKEEELRKVSWGPNHQAKLKIELGMPFLTFNGNVLKEDLVGRMTRSVIQLSNWSYENWTEGADQFFIKTRV